MSDQASRRCKTIRHDALYESRMPMEYFQVKFVPRTSQIQNVQFPLTSTLKSSLQVNVSTIMFMIQHVWFHALLDNNTRKTAMVVWHVLLVLLAFSEMLL